MPSPATARLALALAAVALPLPSPTSAYFLLSQARITGWGAVGNPNMGNALALSGDGTTLALGGYNDAGSEGATWVFSHSNVTGNWTQQGSKLVGVATVGLSLQGAAVALSHDGNTLASGAPWDNTNVGGVVVFTRTSGAWSQQGSILIGTGATDTASQGGAVALSADGNTLASGGQGDNSSVGAVWVFTRSGGVWQQQGPKLVGSGNVGAASQGVSVAISADGNTLAWGGNADNNFVGAAWVFTRNATGAWSSQTDKLVGTGGVGMPRQGSAIALSADGDTLAVGAYQDNSNRGAVWIFTRNGTTWSQLGSKLLRQYWWDYGSSQFGTSVSFGGPGSNLLAVGAPKEQLNRGNTFVLERDGNNAWQPRGLGVMDFYGESGALYVGSKVALSNDGKTLIMVSSVFNNSQGCAWAFTDFTSSPTTASSLSQAPTSVPSSSPGNNSTAPPVANSNSTGNSTTSGGTGAGLGGVGLGGAGAAAAVVAVGVLAVGW